MRSNAPKLDRIRETKLPMAVLGMTPVDENGGFVAACMDGVYRVDAEGDDFQHAKLYEHDSYVSSVVRRESVIISAGYDGTLKWFDLAEAKLVRSLKLHQFWSWDMAISPDQHWLASVTGQYLAGGYKYEPLPEREPSVVILDAESGEMKLELPHVPSVQAVAFSPNSQWVAAGNLMGEIRVWNVESGELAANWTTSDFTSWGIIKSHSYLGGVFALRFTADGDHLLMAGMGQMRDPMAGNGRQLWQKWNWRDQTKADETHAGESGEGLMEALAVSPSGETFAMGGRLRGGDWNVAIFDTAKGSRLAFAKTGYRITDVHYSGDGSTLHFVGTQGQPKNPKNGEFPPFGRVEVYSIR